MMSPENSVVVSWEYWRIQRSDEEPRDPVACLLVVPDMSSAVRQAARLTRQYGKNLSFVNVTMRIVS